jgi:hypothetical protein
MPSEPLRYSISFNQYLADRILRLNRQSKTAGIFNDWADTVRKINDRLEMKPTEAGDPLRHYPGLKLTAYHWLVDRVLVHYTVHDSERIVFIHSVAPVLGHPLEDQA